MKKKKIMNTINEELNLDESDDESDNDKSNESDKDSEWFFYGFNNVCCVLVIHY